MVRFVMFVRFLIVCGVVYILLRRHIPSRLTGCCSFPPSPPVNARYNDSCGLPNAI